MILALEQVGAIARTEWRLAWRGLGMRLTMILLAVSFLPYLLLANSGPDDGGLSVLAFAAPLAGLLAAFLIVPSIGREKGARTADLTWVRPLSGSVYVAGKLAAALLIMAVLLAELAILVGVSQVRVGHGVGYPLVVGVLLVTAPSMILFAGLYVLCAIILPRPFLGYLVAVGLAVLFGLYLNGSMLVLWNPWGHALFYSPALGFGPDWPLLLTSRLVYLGIAVFMIGLGLLVFVRRERRAVTPHGQTRRVLPVIVCGLVLVGLALPRFQAAAAATTLSGPVVQPAAVSATVHGYSLDLQLDPSTGAVQGEARFNLRNVGTTPIVALPLYLNDGLRIKSATVEGRAASVTNTVLFGRLGVTPALRPGGTAAIDVSYAGNYKLLHAEYGSIYQGLQAPSHQTAAGPSMSLFQPAVHQSLIGDGLAQLFGDGDWYPQPWTRALLTRSPPPLDWRGLRIHVPAGVTAIASVAGSSQGQEQFFSWNLHGRLPMAVLAVIPGSYSKIAMTGGALYAPGGGENTTAIRRAQYGPYIAAWRDLNAYFGQSLGPVSVVAMPLANLELGRAVPLAVGGGLILAPVDGIDLTPDRGPLPAARPVAPAAYRAALDDLAAAWWANHLLVNPAGPMIYAGRDDLPAGYIDLTARGWFYDLSLTTYTGAAVAGQHLGPAAYSREMALRRQVNTLRQHDQMAAFYVLQNDRGSLGQAISAAGLQGRLGDSAGPDASPALDDLRQAIGAEPLRRALIALAADGQTQNSENGVACALGRITGRPLTAWMNRYLAGSPFAIKPTSACP